MGNILRGSLVLIIYVIGCTGIANGSFQGVVRVDSVSFKPSARMLTYGPLIDNRVTHLILTLIDFEGDPAAKIEL